MAKGTKKLEAMAGKRTVVSVDKSVYSMFAQYCKERGLIINVHVCYALADYVKNNGAQRLLLEVKQ